jgi:hypothetical protein
MSSSISSCYPNPPFALQLGGVCSSAGVCINSTIHPDLLLCLCNNGYSGASDFFDTRIEQLPDGRFLSLNCGESRAGTCTIWGLVLFLCLIRMKQLCSAILRFYRKHIQDEKLAKAGFLANFPLRTMCFDLFFSNTFILILAISKICGLTLGSDVLPTIALSTLVMGFNWTNFEISRREFAVFVKGTLRGKRADSITRLRTGLKIFGTLVYACVAIIPSIWALTLDKTLGPLENSEFVAIIVRNVGTILWGWLDVFAIWMVRQQIQHSIDLTSSGANDNMQGPITGKMQLDEKTKEVVKRLDKEIRSLLIFMAITGVLYGVFLIPILYPFQTYCIGFIVGAGSLRHSAKSFQGVEGNNSSSGKSNNNQVSVAYVADNPATLYNEGSFKSGTAAQQNEGSLASINGQA